MHDFRAAGKQLRCHAEGATNATYLLLTACDTIGARAARRRSRSPGRRRCRSTSSRCSTSSPSQADFIHVGAYKGAAEPLTRDAPSKEMEETLGAILDRRYQTMVDDDRERAQARSGGGQGADRHGAVPRRASEAPRSSSTTSRRGRRSATSVEGAVDEARDRARRQRISSPTMMKLARFLGAMPPDRPLGDHVAVVYAIGNIKDGERRRRARRAPGDRVAHAGRGAARARRRRLGQGGRAAHRLRWRQRASVRADLDGDRASSRRRSRSIVSMSDVAASGGYYIASRRDEDLRAGEHADRLDRRRRWPHRARGSAREARRQHVPDGPRQARDDDGEPRSRGPPTRRR